MFVYAFHFLLAIIICIFVIIAFARLVCSRAIYVFLRVSYFVFHFSFPGMRISVVCLYPSDDVQRFISEIFKDFSVNHLRPKNLMFPPLLKFVKRFSFSLRVLLSMKFGFKKVFQKNGGSYTQTIK